jgi:hypothetical protein
LFASFVLIPDIYGKYFQELLPKHLHATGLSIYLAICTLFGTLGPIIVGLMQDSYGYSLRTVLAFMLAVNYFSAGVLLLLLAYLHQDGSNNACMAADCVAQCHLGFPSELSVAFLIVFQVVIL